MYDCELPELYDERYVKARKKHTCCECKHPIFPGEEYQKVKGLWDGEFATFKTCSCCAKKRCALSDEYRKHYGYHDQPCIEFGNLEEELINCGYLDGSLKLEY